MKKFFLASAALSLLLGFAVPVYAEQMVTYDERVLTQLYSASLKKGGPDAYIDKRIADERAKVRALADKEVKQLIDAAEKDNADSGLNSSDRERIIVTMLEEQLRDRKVDMDLLQEEEQKFYLNSFYGSGSTDDLRVTSTRQELLAKKANLEERISALQAALTLHHDRLSKLTSDERLKQFLNFFGYGNYILIILLAMVVDRYVRRKFIRKISDKGRRYLVAKLVSAAIWFGAILVVFSKLLSDHPGALASLAIIGAGIAVAMQDVVKDAVGWAIIVQRRLYTLGDRVAVGQFVGDVIDISLLRTTFLEVASPNGVHAHERTGKILTLPNSMVLREAVLNYNAASDFMSAELGIVITYDSNWRKAEQILMETLKKETSNFAVEARKQHKRRTALYYTAWEIGEPDVHLDLLGNGIQFTLKFTVPIGSRRAVVTQLSHTIVERFGLEPDIDFANANGMKLAPST